MGWWEDIKQGVREKAAGLAKDHPETAEKLARWYGGDDTVDMVKFLYADEPGLKGKIDAAKKDPMFAKIYDTVYASTKAQIEEQAKKLPTEWDAAAKAAGIPVNQLIQRMQENGAEKITFAIASSVNGEIENKAWYTGKVLGSLWDEVKREPENDTLLGRIGTFFGNVFRFVTALFDSDARANMERRGEQYVAADTAARAEEIVANMGKMLYTERKMPASFTADTMVAVYEQLKGKADPNFRMSDADKSSLRTRFLTQLQAAAPAAAAAAAAVQPQQPQQVQQQPHPGYSGQATGLPGIATDAQAAAAAEQEGQHSTATRYIRREGEFQPKYPELTELASLDNASLSKLGINPWSWSNNGRLLAAHLMLARTEEEMFNVLKRYIPEASIADRDGEHLVVEAKGIRFYLNKPGASMQDVNDLGPWIIGGAAMIVTGGAASALVANASMGTVGALATHATIAGLSYAGSEALSEWANGYDDESMGEVFSSLLQGATLGPLGAKVMGVAKGTWGAILRKTATNQSLTPAEEQVVKAAGMDKSTLEKIVITMAQSKGVALSAVGSAAMAAGTASATDIPHEDVDPTVPVRPGKTPAPPTSEGYDMSFPLIP